MPDIVEAGERQPIRRVFFSFHYQADIFRVQVIRNHWVPAGSRTASRYFDGSLEEAAKKSNEYAIKQMIGRAFVGCSVTCVLIGTETYNRRWVQYEIFKSIREGMGVFGIRIHQVKSANTGLTSDFGSNPFSPLCLGEAERSERLWPLVKYKIKGWTAHPLANEGIERNAAPYLARQGSVDLGDVFRVYDWMDDNGPRNFSTWATRAAEQAGR